MNLLFLEPDEYYQLKFLEHFSHLGSLLIKSQAADIRQVMQVFHPHILISEVLVQDRTLYEIMEEIEEEIAQKQIPVVVFSRFDNLEDIRAAMGIGVNRYLVKGRDSMLDLKNLLLTMKGHPGHV